MIRKFVIALAVVFVLASGWMWNSVSPFTGPGKPVVVTVNTGDSMSTIIGKFEQAGVISNAFIFHAMCSTLGCPTVFPGSYEIAAHSSYFALEHLLAHGPNVDAIEVRAGMTVAEVANHLAAFRGASFASEFRARLRELSVPGVASTSAEGLLGTGSYIVTPASTPAEIAQTMHDAFISTLASVGMSGVTTKWRSHGLSAYQIIIAASIVEKEGYYLSNMPKVARVILNRLATHSSLQMDSTILYALGRDGGRVTTAMLRIPSPYNTYLHAGLTPTPTCVPSAAALRAMLNPPAGTWRYFVVINQQGDEAFSTTYAGQLANERLARSRGL